VPLDNPLFRQISASSVGRGSDQPESPNTVLRRTLNIAPPAPADTGQQLNLHGGHTSTFQPVKPNNAQKPVDDNSAVVSGVAVVESLDQMHADVTCSLTPSNLITPQALLQTHLSAKVCQA